MTQQLGPKQTQWVEALESGEFKQGKTFLCRENRFCCLGVLCEIEHVDYEEPLESPRLYTDDGVDCYLPIELVEEYCLRDEEGRANSSSSRYKELQEEIKQMAPEYVNVPGFPLVYLNDSDFTFQQIAYILRKYPELYFTQSV